jgi:STIMATE family
LALQRLVPTTDKAPEISGGDECAFYFMQFLLDTVLGMGMIWALLKVQEWAAKR